MRTRTEGTVRRLVALLAFVCAMSIPVAAHAQTLYTGTPVPNVETSVGGGGFQAQARGGSQQSGRLALTGGDIVGLVVIGLGALGTGMALTRGSRRPARR